jgi:hypothetical protein
MGTGEHDDWQSRLPAVQADHGLPTGHAGQLMGDDARVARAELAPQQRLLAAANTDRQGERAATQGVVNRTDLAVVVVHQQYR